MKQRPQAAPFVRCLYAHAVFPDTVPTPQQAGRHFTTPTFWEYLRMERNNKRLWREAQR